MAYIGTSPTQAVRTRFLYTATASQTTFSGADTQNLTLRYSDANFVDVYQNGVLLKGGGADYTATTTTSVVLSTGATADDVIEIIVYDVFAVANLIKKDGDTVEGVINFNGKEITLDADFDTSITADTDDQIDIKIGGTDNTFIIGAGVGVGIVPTTAYGKVVQIHDTGTSGANLRLTDSTSSAGTGNGFEIIQIGVNDYIINRENGFIATFTNGSERTRIDSSGNVLVGRTSTISGGSNSASGAQIGSNGLIQSAVSGDTAISLQRLSDNGDIIQFRKDTTSVGSIGTGSSRLAIGNDDTFLTFAGDLDALYPASSSQTTPRDNAVDLGTSGTRFKDLYLSNSVKIATATNGTALLDLGDTDDSNIGRIGYDNSDNSMRFTTNNSEAMRIDSDGDVGIGTTSPVSNSNYATLTISDTTGGQTHFKSTGGSVTAYVGADSTSSGVGYLATETNHPLLLRTNNTERMRIDTNGHLLIGTTSVVGTGNNANEHIELRNNGLVVISKNAGVGLAISRGTDDGTLVQLQQGGTVEGTIDVSGTTVTYNGFAGSHESSGIPTNTPIGTVVSTIDELDVYFTKQEGVSGEENNPKAGQTRADHAKVKVSDTAGDKAVYGVVGNFNAQGKVNVTSVGIGSVRVTGACARGDLLESNGDGTAKVQSDDIVRSKTLGKVTIGNSNTGVKLVSCVLYCG